MNPDVLNHYIKIIHNISNVCHIEDVVIDNNYRGKNLGTKLIEYAKEYAKMEKCYKIILSILYL